MRSHALLQDVGQAVAKVVRDFPSYATIEMAGQIPFVEQKDIDIERFQTFLNVSKKFNRMANCGPLWHALGAAYEAYFDKLKNKSVVPCANGGMALEALANLKSFQVGRKLRWCVSSFGFVNSGRGFLTGATFLDCDERGLIDLGKVEDLDQNSFDGMIVTNPFGLLQDFRPYIDWQERTGKILLFDNAAGVDPGIPNVPYQALSLHHTKPYGFGEGGLAVVPRDEKDQFLKFIEYQPLTSEEAQFWVNNGKLSDASCALHLMRLESSPAWRESYQSQASRITALAKRLEFKPLIESRVASMSLPLLAPKAVSLPLPQNEKCILGKYYKPLLDLPGCSSIFSRIVNIPSHPGMAALSDDDILDVLQRLISP